VYRERLLQLPLELGERGIVESLGGGSGLGHVTNIVARRGVQNVDEVVGQIVGYVVI
jgi:hypothetical protein